jgi:DNA repair protein RadC
MDVTTVELAYSAFRPLISYDVEEFWVLALGPKKTILGSRMVFRGTVDACLVHPRDIFRFACLQNASSIVVAHNHPSGDPLPSLEDLRFTRRLIRVAELMEIPVIDHLILTRNGFSSMNRDGWCNFAPQQSATNTEPLFRVSESE